MEDFPGLLSRDFGFRAQGKSAPMAASRSTGSVGGGGALNFGIGSGNDTRSSSFSSNRAKPGLNSNAMGGSILDDNDELFGSTASKKTQDLGGYSDVFGGPPKYSNSSDSRGGSTSFDYDSIFQGSHDSGAKSSSLPVFDKPVYDDDIFDGVPGLKSSSSVKYDDVFSSISSPPKKTATYEDFLGNLGKTEPELKSSSRKKSSEVEKDLPGFDDLIPGFGGSSPPKSKEPSETSQPQQSSVPPTKSTSSTIEDPFVVLETTSAPAYSSSGLFSDPLEQISKLGESKSTKADGSSVSGKVFDDMDPLSGLGRSFPVFSTDLNSRRKDVSPTKSGYTSSSKEPSGKASINTSENSLQKKAPVGIFQEPHQTMFDMPTVSSDYKSVGKTDSQPSYVISSETNSDTSPRSEENAEVVDDVWLTVSEIPLFTQPTSAPPPSRPPPPRPTRNLKANRTYFGSENAKKKVNEFSSLPNSTRNFQSPAAVPDVAKSSNVSTIDELEEFAMGRNQINVEERGDVISSEEEAETNYTAAASAAAMKEAMERAEAKFKHAKGVRERENAKAAKSKEVSQQEMDEKAMHDAQEREIREKQEKLDNERQQKEIEEKEREQRRLEKERERAREIEREREKAGRQAVERATREARERAAAEARHRAERTAVEKANAEARERAERAAVQRAQNEARERAAAEARERAERAAAEARERTNAEAREKEARERAAVARAEAEARRRSERAAVERAAAEARERAAAAARENQQKNERTAPASRENQQMNENDLESFFNMGARPSSVPRPRANTSDPFDTQFQNKGGSEGPRRTSVGTTSGMRKVSSTTNIVDDLTSIFGAAPSSGAFQEIDGEGEERRRARLERHQRTQERAAKALAEKNERDLQAQRDQAERHRIAETLDIEIRRWAAGKEGNLRALLSTLQYEAWNKFNSEELF